MNLKSRSISLSCFFFFNDTATTEIYTLSLHDALPILQFVELAADGVDVIERVGPVRVARELRDLPGCEIGEDAHRELPALRLQPADLVLDVDFGFRGHVPELLDLRFELGDRLFEVEERDGHACRVS